MKRRDFLHGAAGFAAAQLLGAQTARKPNIIVIITDDHGWAEIGVQGCKDVPTPTMDSLAKNGVRFSNGYVSCPVCSPTRAGLMTGRYQQRFGHEFNPGPPARAESNFGLPLTETTLPARMKQAGYATGMVGKWHLGYTPEMHPMKRGFDEYFGFLGGAHSYVDAQADSANPILRGMERVNEKEYLTDAFAREAVAFIEKRCREPFFLYFAPNAVHGPMQAPERYPSRFQNIADEKRRTFAGMLSALDEGIGRVLTKLREAGLEENTLILLVGDNGGPTRVTTARNDPLRGLKGQVYEGGIRVPFLAQWKGQIPAGRVFEPPVIQLDIFPTVLAAAGVNGQNAKPLDGVDLLPYVRGDKRGAPHDRLFWRFGAQSAARMGDWKLVNSGEGAPQLFNLARDVGESNDMAATQPDRLKELQNAYTAWNSQLAAPLWGNPRRQMGPGGRARGDRQRNGRGARKRRRAANAC